MILTPRRPVGHSSSGRTAPTGRCGKIYRMSEHRSRASGEERNESAMSAGAKSEVDT